MGTATMENSMELPLKVKNSYPMTHNPFSEYIHEKFKNIYLQNYMHEKYMFIAASFTVTRTWKQPKCPLIDDWVEIRG